MKIRDSGMPDEALWATFFDAEAILDCLGFGPEGGPPGLADVVDLGCGYGTFTIPAARRTHGTVHAFDIEAAMVEVTQRKAHALGLENVVALRRDVLAEGTGLASESCGYVMAFNVLHTARPEILLAEAFRILEPGGRVAIIHWIPDPATPRGPALDIRPTPERCRAWLNAAGFTVSEPTLALPPYHYGLVGTRPG